MEIRRATEADLPDIERIQAASAEAAHWDAADYLTHDCYVSLDGSEVTGFLVSRAIAGEREILNVAVDPHRRRAGCGKALVLHELAAGASAWFLEVRESNTAARKLYTRAGFKEVGKRPNYYSDPTEGGIVMRFLS